MILRVQFIEAKLYGFQIQDKTFASGKNVPYFSQRIKKSTKSVLMLIKHFSIVLKLTDREVTIVNETNFLDIFLLFNKFLSSSWRKQTVLLPMTQPDWQVKEQVNCLINNTTTQVVVPVT